jgi:hypothetical protein
LEREKNVLERHTVRWQSGKLPTSDSPRRSGRRQHAGQMRSKGTLEGENSRFPLRHSVSTKRLHSLRPDERFPAEVGIKATCGDEFIVRALLGDAATFEDVDAVGIAHGGKAVGDDEAGALLHEAFESFLNLSLRLGVHTGGGFIEE